MQAIPNRIKSRPLEFETSNDHYDEKGEEFDISR